MRLFPDFDTMDLQVRSEMKAFAKGKGVAFKEGQFGPCVIISDRTFLTFKGRRHQGHVRLTYRVEENGLKGVEADTLAEALEAHES